MHFPTPLLSGRLIKRYKRFLADIELDSGEIITAHCANSGAMLGATTPGSRVWISYHPSPTRKLSYTWQLVEMDQTYVGINTSLPNALAENAIKAGKIPELEGYENLKREVKYGQNSRIDLLLTDSQKSPCYVEVKNVHLRRDQTAVFPDCVTARGTKHLKELKAVVAQGHRAVMLYIIQRNDCDSFGFAHDLDPTYAATATKVLSNGVEAYAYLCDISLEGISVGKAIPVQV